MIMTACNAVVADQKASQKIGFDQPVMRLYAVLTATQRTAGFYVYECIGFSTDLCSAALL